MIKKKYNKRTEKCRVTFLYPCKDDAKQMVLVGEFNDWDCQAHPMKRLKNGTFSTSINLEVGHSYRFRYLINGDCWTNDPQADQYVQNDFGSEDCIIIL